MPVPYCPWQVKQVPRRLKIESPAALSAMSTTDTSLTSASAEALSTVSRIATLVSRAVAESPVDGAASAVSAGVSRGASPHAVTMARSEIAASEILTRTRLRVRTSYRTSS